MKANNKLKVVKHAYLPPKLIGRENHTGESFTISNVEETSSKTSVSRAMRLENNLFVESPVDFK